MLKQNAEAIDSTDYLSSPRQARVGAQSAVDPGKLIETWFDKDLWEVVAEKAAENIVLAAIEGLDLPLSVVREKRMHEQRPRKRRYRKPRFRAKAF